ncbi:MAG: heat-shock protein Hsp20 [delta proteobacterium ML8_D]|jgi:HSP20 family protein|nr:MAG: heat-shock protein Hsp20 [delta proteobacterium ML8_D]
MDIKKLVPWNWFKKEEEQTSSIVPVKSGDVQTAYPRSGMMNPIIQLHSEMDRLFENAFRGFGRSAFRSELFTNDSVTGLLKPKLDIGATEKEYSITVEVPGVNEKDIKVELEDNTMIIRGEKNQEKEEKDRNYYCIERSYGSFQRVLSLPEDAVEDDILATFKNGILTIKLPRKAIPKANVRPIEVRKA